MAKIIVTGSTGFIGKRLTVQLLQQGHEVYALNRFKGMKSSDPANSNLHILYGDIRDPSSIDPFPKDIDAAYYLMHSLASTGDNLVDEEKTNACNFLAAIGQTNCKQIIYLAGIIEDETALSPHLQSRLAVEKVLNTSKIPITVLRSSIIIGAGSASFEIIRDLVEKLPLMVAPKWIESQCQPIAIQDVLFYLTGVLLNKACFSQTFDIGGPEAITFGDMLLRYAKFRKLKRYIIKVPVLTPKLSSYWLVLITSVRLSICKHLVESMKQNTRKLNNAIDVVLPHECLTYEKALEVTFQKITMNEIESTWMDSWNLKTLNVDVEKFASVPKEGCLVDKKIVSITIPVEEVQRRIWNIGGNQGWYSMNWAWKLRGVMDKLVGGTGLNRGRRHPSELFIGDSVDFWRVLLADEKAHHLILYAEMKVPGEAWLEFAIDEVNMTMIQTATFRPKGLLGRLYWYACLPFHLIIFRNMAKTIAQKMYVK